MYDIVDDKDEWLAKITILQNSNRGNGQVVRRRPYHSMSNNSVTIKKLRFWRKSNTDLRDVGVVFMINWYWT